MNPELKKIADEAVEAVTREYRASSKNNPLLYARLARKLHASGISQVRALQIVDNAFPDERKAWIEAENAGRKLPPLFPKQGESYETRRARALARGGIIG